MPLCAVPLYREAKCCDKKPTFDNAWQAQKRNDRWFPFHITRVGSDDNSLLWFVAPKDSGDCQKGLGVCHCL